WQICAAAGLCRGHVQSLALWPHRHRISRGASGEMNRETSQRHSSSCSGNSAEPVFMQNSGASTSFRADEKDVDGRNKAGYDDGKRRRTVGVIGALALLVLCLFGTFAAWVVSLGPLPLAQAKQVSTTIVDRNGKLLRAYAMADGRWRLPVDARKDI